MIGPSRQSGDTLIACHFPVGQLPSWQLPVQALCSSVKRPSRLCTAGLTRAVSLPERDSINREHVANAVHRHSSSYCSLTEDRAEEEGTSDSSGKYEPSSSPEDSSSLVRRSSCQGKVNARFHNSFLPNFEMDEDEEDEDSDGDNLHRYHEDSSFVLHGCTNWPVNTDLTDLNCYMDSDWGNEAIFGSQLNQEWISNQPNQLEDLQTKCQCYHMGDASIALISNRHVPNHLTSSMSCCIHSLQKCSPEFSNSDSSCNSSDGVLVNFCSIYNKSNNPATPLDLSSPALEPVEGSVFLNLHPMLHSPSQEHRGEVGSSPQSLDSNCNLCFVEPLPAGLTSLEASDLHACLQNRAVLPMGTNQKYYKLVSCDLSSQSPSPAWSSSTSCYPEGQSKSSPASTEDPQQKEHKKVRVEQQTVGCVSMADFPVASTSTTPCRRKHNSLQSHVHPACLLSSNQSSPQGSKCQGTSTETTPPSGNLDRDHSDAEVTDNGMYSGEPPVLRFTKAQRPTSLPIQPFVLVPKDKPLPQCQPLGSLLEQYILQKSNKGASSQSDFTFKGKRSQCFTNLQLSPMGSHCPVFLEPPSSSDTCSTCTPSPDCFRHVWSRSGISPSMLQPPKVTFDKTSPYSDKDVLLPPNRATLVKIPTYRNLIHLTPEQQDNRVNNSKCSSSNSSMYTMTPPVLPVTGDQVSMTSPSNVVAHNKLYHFHAEPTSGFLRRTMTAAAASVAPLSSLLRSWTSSGLNPPQDFCSERPSTEFCMSPDTSYESMSISHLQRKGLLRAVSRAVDLIMVHFGSSRDPEEKMRLGNSSCSPTIAGLVLEHLCPSIQNILEDGLRDHKLDPIIGQRRTHSWRVVELSTRIGSSTKVLSCLVSKIRQYPQLTDHCMKLRAFIMGLLNLRSLEFWLSHLHAQKDVVTMHYHSWGFLPMSLGRCQPLFQELLLLLQPLSVLPFDLNLLLEPRFLCNRQQLCPEDLTSPPAPSSGLLATSWPLLQADRRGHRAHSNQMSMSHQKHVHTFSQQEKTAALTPELQDFEPTDAVVVGEDCTQEETDHWSQISMESRQEEQRDILSTNEGRCQSDLGWASLFGAANPSTSAVTVSQNHTEEQSKRVRKRPSEWLQLDRSQLGLIAQSLMSMKLGASGSYNNKQDS